MTSRSYHFCMRCRSDKVPQAGLHIICSFDNTRLPYSREQAFKSILISTYREELTTRAAVTRRSAPAVSTGGQHRRRHLCIMRLNAATCCYPRWRNAPDGDRNDTNDTEISNLFFAAQPAFQDLQLVDAEAVPRRLRFNSGLNAPQARAEMKFASSHMYML